MASSGSNSSPIKVLIGEAPRLLLEIVRELMMKEPSIHVLAANVPDDDLPARTAELRPDVVIFSCNAEDADRRARAMLRCAAPTKVVAMTGDGRDAFLLELHPRRSELRDLSPRTLLAAIRSRVSSSRDH